MLNYAVEVRRILQYLEYIHTYTFQVALFSSNSSNWRTQVFEKKTSRSCASSFLWNRKKEHKFLNPEASNRREDALFFPALQQQ